MKLKFTERLGYGIGDFGSQFAFFVVNTYFMIFMTNIMGISNTTAGAIYAIVMIFDAINDPIIGNIADRTRRTKAGKYRKWVIGASVPYALAMWLSFWNPGWGMTGKVIWALAIHLVYTVCATAWQVPYGSLPTRMTTSTNERVLLGTFRDWFANLAKFAIGYVCVMMLSAFSANPEVYDAKGYFLMAGICALICVVFCTIAGFSSKEKVEVSADAAPEGNKISIFAGLKSVFFNRDAVLVMFAAFLATVALNFKSAVTPYYAAYNLGNPALAGTILPLIFTLPLLLAFAVPYMTKWLGIKGMFIFSMVCVGLSGVASLVSTSFTMIIIASLLMSVMAAFLPPVLWGVLPQLADYGEWKDGVSCPGAYYSLNAFFIKASTGLSGLMIGWALDWGGFDATLATQPQSALDSIFAWHGIVPIVCGVVGIVLMLFYKLTPEKLAKAQEELLVRRAGE